ncbi:MAG: hypothetical protein ACHQHO_06540 [Solirubrobacterales bacterium]
MRTFTLLGLTSLLLMAATGIATAAPPLILVLEGEKISELKYEGTSGEVRIDTVGGQKIKCTGGKIKATYTPIAGKAADAESGSSTIDYEGCKKGAGGCRSEVGGVKDPVETILVPLAFVAGSEESTSETLQFLLVSGTEEPLELLCGAVKGTLEDDTGCLVTPALKEVTGGGTVTISCLEEKGVPITGKCLETTFACEDLSLRPLKADLGAGNEGAALDVEFKGTFNKMIFLDD